MARDVFTTHNKRGSGVFAENNYRVFFKLPPWKTCPQRYLESLLLGKVEGKHKEAEAVELSRSLRGLLLGQNTPCLETVRPGTTGQG